MAIDLPIQLRKGKPKSFLESSIDSALLAIEIYNKPRTAFRSEGYIAMMIIAWTKLLHAYFQAMKVQYYYKEKNGRYKIREGEKLAWELSTCIKEYNALDDTISLPEPVVRNLRFFIKLRNKIEHRHINKKEVDVSIFGECQSLLFNYENLVINLFGESFALHESLVFALQLSHMRRGCQIEANKSALAKDVLEIKKFIEDYRTALPQDVFSAPEYSIKLIAIPKISNTGRGEVAIEFVKLDQDSEVDRETCDQILALTKDKKIPVEGCNIGKLKPQGVCDAVNGKLGRVRLTIYLHTCLVRIFNIRPQGNADDPFDTNALFCHYDEAHNDYLYNNEWVDFVAKVFEENKLTVDDIRSHYSNKVVLNVSDYE